MRSKEQPEGEKPRGVWRFLPLLLILAGTATVFALGWHRYLSFDALVENYARLTAFVAANRAAALALFALVYVAAVALSVPGASLLTLTAGLLFGTLLGGLTTLIAATAGAVIVFLAARTSLGDVLRRRAGDTVGKLLDGFNAEGFSYLLFLRLAPVFPFWLVNLAPALAGMRLAPFAAATAIGIVPGTFAFASVGAGLGSVVAAQAETVARCHAEKGADALCKPSLELSTLVTRELLVALAALAVLALVPIVVRKMRAARGREI